MITQPNRKTLKGLIVYRLEHRETKEGPWRGSFYYYDDARVSGAWCAISERCGSSETHPGWREFSPDEYANMRNLNYATGCISLEQVFDWFECDWFDLYTFMDMALVKYRVSGTVYISAHQVCFNPDDAEYITEIDPDTYIDMLSR